MIARAPKGIFAGADRTFLAHSRPFYRFVGESHETSDVNRSFAMPMKMEQREASDRRVIRVDVPPTQVGIAAALRRAFEAAASEPCERDFAELLRRLN
jgi:hypothetical protein